MKTLNGNKFEVQLVVGLEFTYEEADRFLACPPQNRTAMLNELMSKKNPVPEIGNYNVEAFLKEIGPALVAKRERELKQLPEKTGE